MSAWRLDADLGWQRHAACKNTGPTAVMQRALADRFFANHAPTLDIVRACKACPVVQQCLQWALDNDEHGYWGGLSETQRKRLKRGVA